MKGDVLISGLGIAGPTLAYWLRQYGYTPVIVERAPTPRSGGYMIDFWGLGYEVAERMQLLPALLRDGYRLDELRIVDERGRRVAGFDAHVFQTASGGRFVSISRGDLARRIYDSIDGSVEVIFSDSIRSLTAHGDGIVAGFEHAAERHFDIVVGADGLHSNVRSLRFGADSAFERYLGYYTAAFSAHAYPHRDEGAYVSYSVPGRQVARYALRDGRSAFFFMFAEPEPLRIAAHDQRAQQQLVRDTFAGTGWECDEILATMDDAGDFYFDAVAQAHVPAWHSDRVVLVGDAAYCPSLLAGEGASFGMAGAYVLAHALAHSDSYTSAFATYQRSFKPFIDRKQVAAARFARWFAPRTRAQLFVRNAMTNVLNVPVLGDWFAGRSFRDDYTLPS